MKFTGNEEDKALIERLEYRLTTNEELAKSLIEQLNMSHYHLLSFSQKSRLEIFGKLETLQGLVLKHGVGRYGSKLPKGIRKGAPKLCFMHAFNLMLQNEQRFIYCEGFGIKTSLGIVVGEHAWVLDKENNYQVVDKTWSNPDNGVYLGIPFKPTYVIEAVCKKKTYGLLDDWQNKWPVLREEDPNKFLHEEADKILRDFNVGDLPNLSEQVASLQRRSM